MNDKQMVFLVATCLFFGLLKNCLIGAALVSASSYINKSAEMSELQGNMEKVRKITCRVFVAVGWAIIIFAVANFIWYILNAFLSTVPGILPNS